MAPELRARYFEPAGGRYALRSELRGAVIFSRHDLVRSAPPARLDLLVCRNTLMYLDAGTQGRILSRFHAALHGRGEGPGYLFLGRAEMLLAHARLFTPLDLECRIFARRPQAGPPRARAGERPPLDARLGAALGSLGCAAVVVNHKLEILLWSRRAAERWGLRAEEVLGRSLLGLDTGLPTDALRGLIRSCLGGEADYRELVLDTVDRRGRPVGCRVACAPLVTAARRREGAILVMDEAAPASCARS